MVDLGPETDARVGDEVVLIGRSGGLEITVTDLAELKGSIPCEITCQIGARVRRVADPAAGAALVERTGIQETPTPAGAVRD